MKIAFRFRERFWDDAINFVHAPGRAMPTWWTAAPLRSPVLTGWAGGPKAAALSGGAKPDLLNAAIQSLAALFQTPQKRLRSLLKEAYAHDWPRDPFARGAYSYVMVGGHGAREALAAPLARTLYFAGEAADFEGEHAGRV